MTTTTLTAVAKREAGSWQLSASSNQSPVTRKRELARQLANWELETGN
jgi:hypothetical protein